MLTQKELKDILHYDPDTGLFSWVSSSKGTKKSDAVGSIMQGYLKIWINQEQFLAHRLAWLYVYGDFPPANLDHINNIRIDNRISNLRLCNQSQNCANTRINKNNSSGVKGVSWDKKTKKWYAKITINYKQKSLGRFSDLEAAKAAYREAATKNWGEFARC